jgi:hypothetical protein
MQKLQHKFVESMPQQLEDGVLYVSIRFRIVSHKCCCGCGNEIVTNLSPAGWQLVYDGESISLFPSIGNWTLPCRSHYWIKNNSVQWAEAWSQKRILLAQKRDALVHEKYYSNRPKTLDDAETTIGTDEVTKGPPKKSLWRKLRKWLS